MSYNPTASGKETAVTESHTKWDGRGICPRRRTKLNVVQREFRVKIVKMIQDLRKRMKAHIQKIQKNVLTRPRRTKEQVKRDEKYNK